MPGHKSCLECTKHHLKRPEIQTFPAPRPQSGHTLCACTMLVITCPTINKHFLPIPLSVQLTRYLNPDLNLHMTQRKLECTHA